MTPRLKEGVYHYEVYHLTPLRSVATAMLGAAGMGFSMVQKVSSNRQQANSTSKAAGDIVLYS
jgi:hypothetical protein